MDERPVSPETGEGRFRRVKAIFDAAGFHGTLGVRLESVGPGTCKASLSLTSAHAQQHGFVHACVVSTLTIVDQRPLAA